MSEIKLQTTNDIKLDEKRQQEAQKNAPESARFNRHATSSLIEVLSSQQGMVNESLNRTLGKLNTTLDHLLKGQSDNLAQGEDAQSLQKLSYDVISRDVKLQERVAQALSSPNRLIRSRDAQDSLKNSFDNLPKAIKEDSTGPLLSRAVLESLVTLADKDAIGAGLERDLSLKKVYISDSRPQGRATLASGRILNASLAYIESNQPKVLATLQESSEENTSQKASTQNTQNPQDEDLNLELKRSKMSTAQVMTEYLKKALEEFPEDSTYLDIFKKNAQGIDGKDNRNSQRIREVIYNASQMAKTRNLYPGAPDPTVETAEESFAVNDENTFNKNALNLSADPDARSYIDDPKDKTNVEGSRMSLAELSARAAKLQMQFTRERQRMVQEGQLPDPATMPPIDESIPQGDGSRNYHQSTLRIPRSSVAALAQNPLVQASMPPKAQNDVTQSLEIEASKQELLKTQDELLKLKAELAKVQAEALQSAKETVNAQLQTQKELKAQAEAWYQSIQEAGAMAKSTIDALKQAANSALKVTEHIPQETKASQTLEPFVQAQVSDDLALKENLSSPSLKLQAKEEAQVQTRDPKLYSQVNLNQTQEPLKNPQEGSQEIVFEQKPQSAYLNLQAQSDSENFELKAPQESITQELLDKSQQQSTVFTQDGDVSYPQETNLDLKAPTDKAQFAPQSATLNDSTVTEKAPKAPANPTAPFDDLNFDSSENSLEERLYRYVGQAKISDTADEIKIDTALKLDSKELNENKPALEQDGIKQVSNKELTLSSQDEALKDEFEVIKADETKASDQEANIAYKSQREIQSSLEEQKKDLSFKNLQDKAQSFEQKLEEPRPVSLEKNAVASEAKEIVKPEVSDAKPQAPAQTQESKAQVENQPKQPETSAQEQKLYSETLKEQKLKAQEIAESAKKASQEASKQALADEAQVKEESLQNKAYDKALLQAQEEAQSVALNQAQVQDELVKTQEIQVQDKLQTQTKLENKEERVEFKEQQAQKAQELETIQTQNTKDKVSESEAQKNSATTTAQSTQEESLENDHVEFKIPNLNPDLNLSVANPNDTQDESANEELNVSDEQAHLMASLAQASKQNQELVSLDNNEDTFELNRPTNPHLNVNLDIDDPLESGSAEEFSKLYQNIAQKQSASEVDAEELQQNPAPKESKGSEIKINPQDVASLMSVKPSDDLEDDDTLQGIKTPLADESTLEEEIKAPTGQAAQVSDETLSENEVKPGFFSRLASFFR